LGETTETSKEKPHRTQVNFGVKTGSLKTKGTTGQKKGSITLKGGGSKQFHGRWHWGRHGIKETEWEPRRRGAAANGLGI